MTKKILRHNFVSNTSTQMFGFPKVDRSVAKSFNTNFLHTVIWQVKFDHNRHIIEKREEVIDLLKDVLPKVRVGVVRKFELSGGIESPLIRSTDEAPTEYQLISLDGNKTLTFGEDSISYVVNGKVYNDFDELSVELEPLEQVYIMCHIDQFTRAAVRKINIVDFSYGTPSVPSVDFSAYFVQKPLGIDYNYFPDSQLVQQSIQTINYVSSEGMLNLKYGLTVPEREGKNGEYVVDIDVVKQHSIERSNLKGSLTSINDEVFNVFNWVLSDSAKLVLSNDDNAKNS